jgi:uncharacterized protein (TIGR02246 family)
MADRTDDLVAIERVVARLEHAQQHELVDEFVDLFRVDAIWTTGHGRLLNGRDEIAAFTRQVLPGATAGSTTTYRIREVLFVRPDVAAVKVVQQPVTLDGEPIPGAGLGSPLYVMAREEDGWKLVACQNTAVLD